MRKELSIKHRKRSEVQEKPVQVEGVTDVMIAANVFKTTLRYFCYSEYIFIGLFRKINSNRFEGLKEHGDFRSTWEVWN